MGIRTIIFRGKRVDNGKWVYGNYAFTDNDGKQHFIYQNSAFEYAVIPETVGQYTGLTDKNGKRIFEGDIVKVTTIDECSVNVSKIGIGICEETNSDVLSMGVYCIVDRTAVVFPCNDEYKSLCEVIGNIHDNSELIGGDSDAREVD